MYPNMIIQRESWRAIIIVLLKYESETLFLHIALLGDICFMYETVFFFNIRLVNQVRRSLSIADDVSR